MIQKIKIFLKVMPPPLHSTHSNPPPSTIPPQLPPGKTESTHILRGDHNPPYHCPFTLLQLQSRVLSTADQHPQDIHSEQTGVAKVHQGTSLCALWVASRYLTHLQF